MVHSWPCVCLCVGVRSVSVGCWTFGTSGWPACVSHHHCCMHHCHHHNRGDQQRGNHHHLPPHPFSSGRFTLTLVMFALFVLCQQTGSSAPGAGNIVAILCVCSQAEAIQVNPLYVLIPTTLCTSYSFLLPVSNPPNAVVFSYGHLTIMDMVRRTPTSGKGHPPTAVIMISCRR